MLVRHGCLLLLGVAVIAGFARSASAQTFPSQSVDLEGKVDRFTLSSSGLLDGFLLDDGTEVHVAPYLARQLGRAIRRGESVRITGLRIPDVQVVVASFVLGENTHETVIDRGEAGTVASRPATGSSDVLEAGAVTHLLHGQKGQVDGAVLDTGLIVRLPPNALADRLDLLVVGQQISVKGVEIDTEYGRMLRIESMGASDSELSPVR